MSRTLKIISLFILGWTLALPAQNIVPRAKYLEFARTSADWTWNHLDSLVQDWQDRFDPENIWGYRPPPRLLEIASIYATLFQLEGNQQYADRAKQILLTYGDYRRYFPEEAARLRVDYSAGTPALPDFFTAMRYLRAYDILKKYGVLTRSQQKVIEQMVAHSIDYLFQTQEWGAMNRAILRAESLAWAIRAAEQHPDIDRWRMYEKALGFDNWGNWQIEDASLYNAVWLYSLLGYADAKNEIHDLFRTPEIYYYAHYFLQLMCPDMMIPDFGDSNWRSNWSRFLVYFEAAANVYRDPYLKWAATVIADKFFDFNQIQNTGLAYMALDCYRYGTDDILPKQPETLSSEVMEDMVGKKVVFRTGWSADDTYLLLNYRDEGDGGLLFRDYLRDGIPVEEEKMTHGHSDENSIVLLMSRGSVLLHDGGYRDYMPSGPYGAFRQDYFHNRLCVRAEKIWMGQKQGEYRYGLQDRPEIPGQSVLDFLRNAGSYRAVRTQKIDFLSFDDFDYSRTRVVDDKMGYQWDRTLVYLKQPELFVVFDVLKGLKEEYFTGANLWHTRQILAQGDHWYDTCYDSLARVPLPTENQLLIYFPKTHYRLEQVEQAKRYYQDEWVISQTTAQYFELGQHVGFVTVLIPHPADSDATHWVEKIRYVPSSDLLEKGMSVEIQTGKGLVHCGIKSDLRMDMIRDYRRPKYTYESGKIQFGEFESNGDFFFLNQSGNQLQYTVVNVSKAVYQGKELFRQKPALYGLAFDGSPDQAGIGKLRYWRDVANIK